MRSSLIRTRRLEVRTTLKADQSVEASFEAVLSSTRGVSW